MVKSGNHFDEFKPHTRYKHLLLKNYFEAWGHKLGLRAGAGSSILYVDACAGRGKDDIGNQGSPLIAAVAAAMAQESVSRLRKVPFSIHVRAVESNRSHYKRLKILLGPFGHVQVLEGTLAEHMDAINREFGGVAGLFFIDPFGMAPLNAKVIARALEGQGREVLILFADQAALRHFGAITAQETRAEQKHRQASELLPLFPTMPPGRGSELAAAESRQSLETTRLRAIEIMDTAYGDAKWIDEVEKLPQEQRRQALIEIFSKRLQSWGASHVLCIPVADISGTHVYTLIHASKSPKAYATMKEAVAYALKNGPLPLDVTRRMREMVRSDEEKLAREIERYFAGQRVRWAEDPSDRGVACIRNYLLEQTPAFPFELAAMKRRLSPWRLPGKSIVYKFPER